MQREVREERDAVAAAARREAAQQHRARAVGDGPERPAARAPARACAACAWPPATSPAERALLVGGDFYDAMVLPDGRLAVMVGDMAGHGAPAAAQAAGLRFGWRTLVSVEPEPGRRARGAQRPDGRPRPARRGPLRLDHLHARSTRAARSASPPPATRRPSSSPPSGCQPLEPLVSRPAARRLRRGRVAGHPRRRCRPGGTIVLYTDGLIEARRAPTPSASSGPARCWPPSAARRWSCAWSG